MSITVSQLNSSPEEFFSVNLLGAILTMDHIKAGLQGCKYLRICYTHFIPGVPILPPQTLFIVVVYIVLFVICSIIAFGFCLCRIIGSMKIVSVLNVVVS